MGRPIYLAIMAAFEAGRGIHLTAEEVRELGMDDAISHRAAVTLDYDDAFATDEFFTWTAAYALALKSQPSPIGASPAERLGRPRDTQ